MASMDAEKDGTATWDCEDPEVRRDPASQKSMSPLFLLRCIVLSSGGISTSFIEEQKGW
jgi:hypothetical protein